MKQLLLSSIAARLSASEQWLLWFQVVFSHQQAVAHCVLGVAASTYAACL